MLSWLAGYCGLSRRHRATPGRRRPRPAPRCPRSQVRPPSSLSATWIPGCIPVRTVYAAASRLPPRSASQLVWAGMPVGRGRLHSRPVGSGRDEVEVEVLLAADALRPLEGADRAVGHLRVAAVRVHPLGVGGAREVDPVAPCPALVRREQGEAPDVQRRRVVPGLPRPRSRGTSGRPAARCTADGVSTAAAAPGSTDVGRGPGAAADRSTGRARPRPGLHPAGDGVESERLAVVGGVALREQEDASRRPARVPCGAV